MRKHVSIAALTLIVASCGDPEQTPVETAPDPTPDPTCTSLYGTPNENTGLDAGQCMPSVQGDSLWTPPMWNDDSLGQLRRWTLSPAFEVPSEDPYATEDPPTSIQGAVCAVVVTGAQTYRLETFESAQVALAQGATITHGGQCGLCSSLADLAAYAGTQDLTEPVRACGIEGLGGDLEAVHDCIVRDVGFSAPCARIWAYNARNTQQQCLDTCLALLSAPYHTEDGALNACLACDEEKSGPVFKAIAGRTRRNSGLSTAICRPCETVWRLDHEYP